MTTKTIVRFEKRATGRGHYFRPDGRVNLAAVRDVLRGLDRSSFKSASIGGEQESGFEQAFSSLAYAYMKDKAPRLIDFIVGFQLVDRNEDNTKAMGVFGFKVGDQWLYAPTFFLNGDLKGHELLYIKKQDAFVPMKENWVNYLISRKPHVLGEASPQDAFQLGGIPPDVFRMTHPPGSSKYGSDRAYRPQVQDWSGPFLGLTAAVAVKSDAVFGKHAGVEDRLDLRKFLSEDFELLKAAFDLTRKYPLIKQGFDRFYGKDFFSRAGEEFRKEASSLIKTRPDPSSPRAKRLRRGDSLIEDASPAGETRPVKRGSLRVTVRDDATGRSWVNGGGLLDGYKAAAEVDGEAPGGFVEGTPQPDQDDQEKLLRDGVVIKDTREDSEKSVAYNTQVRLELVNPGDTGVYDVLEKPGKFDEMIVVMHPQTNRGREEYCTVVRKDSPKNWLNIHHSNLWVQASPGADRVDFKKWFDGLGGTKDLEKGGTYLAVGPNGAGTTPFRVKQSYGDGAYQVSFLDYCQFGKDKPTWARNKGYNHGLDYVSDGYGEVSTYDAKLFFNKNEGSSLRSVAGELSIPDNFKVFKLSDPPKAKDDGDSLIGCCFPEDGGPNAGSEKRPIQPGNLVDIQLMLHEKTAQLKILDAGCEVYIKRDGRPEERMNKRAALISLVRDHGLDEGTARSMLKSAAGKGNCVWRIKYADGFGGPNQSSLYGGPSAPAMPAPYTGYEQVGYGAVPSIYPQEEFNQISEMSSSRTDPAIYDPFYQPDQRAMQMAQEAGASGQKEVFDTAMISGMLKAVRQDSLVDRYLGDLMKALDKLGRILFMFYWHNEEFEDRYGKQDLPEMGDSIRNSFENLGDVCLYLQEKQVGGGMNDFQGFGDSGQSEPSIEETARN